MNDLTLPIAYPNNQSTISIPSSYLSLPLSKLFPSLTTLIGYSQRLYLYSLPFSPFSSLAHLSDTHTLAQIQQHYPEVTVTYNNTQFQQQPQSQTPQPHNTQSLLLLLQICQSSKQPSNIDTFTHQRYYVSSQGNISFLKAICNRYGTHIYLAYYTLKISLDIFHNQELLQNTIQHFQDDLSRIIIYIFTTQPPIHPLTTVKGNLKIKQQSFIQVSIDNHQQRYLIHRRSNYSTTLKLLSLAFNSQFQASIDQTNFSSTITTIHPKCSKIYLRTVKNQLFPINPIPNCILIGAIKHRIYLIQQSYILHIYKLQPQLHHYKSCILHTKPTIHNDQDIAYLTQNHLILYSISKTYITLKYFDMDGKYLYSKRQVWLNDLYEIQFNINNNVVDLLSVKIKTSKTTRRFFTPDNPKKYIQIQNYTQSNMFFPARYGFNSFSDNSGLFAITNYQQDKIAIYSLNQLSIVCIINQNLLTKVINVVFSSQQQSAQKKIYIHYQSNKIHIYKLKFDKKNLQLYQIIEQVLLENKFFNKSFIVLKNQKLIFFDENNIFEQFQSQGQRVQKNVILLEISTEGKYRFERTIVKSNPFLIKQIKGFYLLKAKQTN